MNSDVNNAFLFSDSDSQNPRSNTVVDAASPTTNWQLGFPPNLEAFDGQASSRLPELPSQLIGLAMNPETTNTTTAWTNFDSMLLDSGPVQVSSSLPEVPMSPSFGLAMNPEATDSALSWTAFEGMLMGGGDDQACNGPAERAEILGAREESATISPPRLQSSQDMPHSPSQQLLLCSASRDTKVLSENYTLAASTASNWNLPHTVSNAQSTLLAPLEVTDSLEPFSFFGTHPEDIIPQLQRIRSELFKCQDSRYLERRLGGSGISKNLLAREITSGWLLSELDDMLCWSYDVSAKRIRQRRARAGDRRGLNQNFSLARYCDDGRVFDPDVEDVWRGRPAPQLGGKMTCLLRTRGGYATRGGFQVELREASKKPTENHGCQSPYSVILHSVPEGCGPKIGISVAFSGLSAVSPKRLRDNYLRQTE